MDPSTPPPWPRQPPTPGRPRFYFNQTKLCGNQSLEPWVEEEGDVGRCFQTLVLLAPSHSLLGLVSAYAVGVKYNFDFPRTRMQRWAILLRYVSHILRVLNVE